MLIEANELFPWITVDADGAVYRHADGPNIDPWYEEWGQSDRRKRVASFDEEIYDQGLDYIENWEACRWYSPWACELKLQAGEVGLIHVD